jgi:hypothetical protein
LFTISSNAIVVLVTREAIRDAANRDADYERARR